jgi:hypothetical protein
MSTIGWILLLLVGYIVVLVVAVAVMVVYSFVLGYKGVKPYLDAAKRWSKSQR